MDRDKGSRVPSHPRGLGFRRVGLLLMRNEDRFHRLKNLTPVEAARAWLSGEFGILDEPAMIEAIRKDERIKLPDAKIAEFFFKALDKEERDPQRCLDELGKLS
jgi:hypothetical protein